MCRRAAIVYTLCTCMRCRFSRTADPGHTGYYPHYGSPIVAGDGEPGYTCVLVELDDMCRSAVINHSGYWLACDNPPEDYDTRFTVAGTAGRHLCTECDRVCYGLREDFDLRGLDLLEVSDDEGDGETVLGIEPEPELETEAEVAGRLDGDAVAGDAEDRPRGRSALPQRIYRQVLALLGYPEGTRLPFDESGVAYPAGL